MRFLAYEGGRGSGDRRADCGALVLSGGSVERFGFGAGLRASLVEEVGEGDADSTAVMM